MGPTDMERLLAVPRKAVPSYLAETMTEVLRLRPDAPRLSAEQAEFLYWAAMLPYPQAPGGQLGVGAGKTLITLLLPHVWQAKRPVLLVPPDLVDNTREEFMFWRPFYPVVLPKIMTYTALSAADGEARLHAANPDALILDEAHSLSLVSSARTRRFLRFLANREDCRVAVMSGTLIDRDVPRYYHLLAAALREESPAPITPALVASLHANLADKAEPDPHDASQMRRVCAWAGREDPFEAMHARLATAPGMVVSTGSACAVPLHLHLHHRPVSAGIHDALAHLRETWELPSGEPVLDAARLSVHRANMCLGFFYQWETPPSDEWLEARRNLSREIRIICQYRDRPGFDTPATIRAALEAQPGLRSTYQGVWLALQEWAKVEHEPMPRTRAVWLDEGAALRDTVDALLAGMERHGAAQRTGEPLLWYWSRAVGEKLAEWGWDVRGQGSPKPDGERAACSVRVFHKGHRFHMYDRAALIQPVLNPGTWQQLLGRLHRRGQAADRVDWHVAQVGWPQHGVVRRATELATATQSVMGEPQKLLFAERHHHGVPEQPDET